MYQSAKPENLPQIQIDEAEDIDSSVSAVEVLEEVDEPGEFHENPFADQTEIVSVKKVRT